MQTRALETAIAALEAQRAALGDAVVDAALGPLREQLGRLHTKPAAPEPAGKDAGAAAGAAAMAPAAAAVPAQQLKRVSVLFLDVVGSTALSQHLEPEDLSALLDGLLARCTAIVQQHGGKVLQYAGDSLLAAFGAEQAQEDDAERAVHCGLALLAEGRRLGAEVLSRHGQAGCDVRVGIHTGPVLLGGGVDEEGTIRGLTVNVAARMEQTAPPGAVRISHDTWLPVRGVFEAEVQPPIVVKGRDAPLLTYLVQRARPRPLRLAARGLEGVPTPLVGRAAELQTLVHALDAVASGRRPAAFTLIAEPGVGKTRLLHELQSRAAEHRSTWWLLKARTHPQTRLQPYGLLRDLLAWRLQIPDSASAEAARASFEAGLMPWLAAAAAACEGDAAGAPAESARAAVHRLGQLVGLDYASSPHVKGLSPQRLREAGFAALRQWLHALMNGAPPGREPVGGIAVRFEDGGEDGGETTGELPREAVREGNGAAPVLLLLEDLHWADEASLDFVAGLLHEPPAGPLLLVASARPELLEQRPAWGLGGGGPGDGAGDAAGDATSDAATGAATDAASEQAGARTSTRTSAPASAPASTPPSAPASDGARPGAHRRIVLQALAGEHEAELAQALLARLAGDPHHAELLALLRRQAAGNPFYMEELVRMLLDEGVLQRQGGGLVAAADDTWRLAPGGLAALRVPGTLVGVLQARLDALPAAERAALQQAAIVGPVFWDAALAALDPAAPARLPALQQRSLVRPQPASAFEDTPERCFSHHLLQQVTYDTVLKPARRAGHAAAAAWLAQHAGERQAEFLAITAEHYERAGDAGQAFDFLLRAAQASYDLCAGETGLAYAQRALAIARSQDDPLRRCRALDSLSMQADGLGRRELQRQFVDEWVAASGAAGLDAEHAEALWSRALYLSRVGDERGALAVAREVGDLARRHGLWRLAATARAQVAWSLNAAGRATEALREAREALRAIRSLPREQQGMYTAQLLVMNCELERSCGHLAAALGFGREAADEARAAGSGRSEIHALMSLGQVFGDAGQPGEAKRVLQQAREQAQALGLEPLVAKCDHDLAMVLVAFEAWSEAEAPLALAQAHAFSDAALLRAELGATRARHDAACGRVAAADAAFAQALQAAAEAESPALAARILAWRLRAWLQQGRVAEARAQLDALLATQAEPPEGTPTAEDPRQPLVLWAAHEVLVASGEPAPAQRLAQQARQQLLAWAALVGDPALEHTYLHQPQHRPILGLD